MSYIFSNPGVVLSLLAQHILMTATALLISVALALPLSALAYRHPRFNTALMGALGVFYTIPSIAFIILLVPLLGLNARAVIVALVVYTQVILVRNFVAGLQGVPAAILEAARGMGMSTWQIWARVQLPLALPVMLAGVRIAVVVAVAIGTVGAKFGAGGLGKLLFDGISQPGRYDKIWAGALTVAALALTLNWGLQALEARLDVERRAAHEPRPAC